MVKLTGICHDYDGKTVLENRNLTVLPVRKRRTRQQPKKEHVIARSEATWQSPQFCWDYQW